MDEDVNFALSLVPTLKSLHDFQKTEAKIQIMNVLNSLKWPHASQSSTFASNRPYEGYNPQYQPGPFSMTPYLGGPSEAGAQYAAGPTPDTGFTGTEINRQLYPIPPAHYQTSESDETIESYISNFTGPSEPDFLSL
jgi:hypothetical protein